MSFEQLRVYQAAVLLDQLVLFIISRVKRGHSKDIDQLRRAAASILYNIAEAFGSDQPGRKIYFLQVARGSADEARAILQRLVRAGAVAATESEVRRAMPLSMAIAKMLTSWINAISNEG